MGVITRATTSVLAAGALGLGMETLLNDAIYPTSQDVAAYNKCADQLSAHVSVEGDVPRQCRVGQITLQNSVYTYHTQERKVRYILPSAEQVRSEAHYIGKQSSHDALEVIGYGVGGLGGLAIFMGLSAAAATRKRYSTN